MSACEPWASGPSILPLGPSAHIDAHDQVPLFQKGKEVGYVLRNATFRRLRKSGLEHGDQFVRASRLRECPPGGRRNRIKLVNCPTFRRNDEELASNFA